mgnify:CR=1 FL=1
MSNADQYAVMQQRPVVSGLARSVFADADKSQISGVNPVRLDEIQCGHIVIRGLENVIKEVVQSSLEFPLQSQLLSCHDFDLALYSLICHDYCVYSGAEHMTKKINCKSHLAVECL